MFARVKDICSAMEQIAPAYLAESWDNTGLAIGDVDGEVKKILVALDVIEPVIDEAIAMQADMILTHHPMLLFQKFDSITTKTPLGRRIMSLIQNNISALSAHTNLDVAKGGTNDILADLIGLQNVEMLEETYAQKLKKIVVYVPKTHIDMVRAAMCGAGCGHIGAYAGCTFGTEGMGTFLPLEGTTPFVGEVGKMEQVEEIRLESIVSADKADFVLNEIKNVHPYEEMAYDIYAVEQKGKMEGIGRIGELATEMDFRSFAEYLQQKLGLDHIRLVGNPTQKIRKVALCTGSGAGYLSLAKEMGADVYLTGDMKFHEAQKAVESGICVADVTHYASEVLAVPVLKEKMERIAREQGWEMEIVCSKVDGQTFWHI